MFAQYTIYNLTKNCAGGEVEISFNFRRDGDVVHVFENVRVGADTDVAGQLGVISLAEAEAMITTLIEGGYEDRD